MPSAMRLPREMSPLQFAVRIGPQELGHIITLRKNLDYMAVLARFAEHYARLGWSLAAREAHSGTDLDINFTLPRKAWSRRLMDECLKGREVNLAVRLGASSRLFVVKIESGAASRQPERFGPWRSTCVAVAGAAQEQHFFHMPDTWGVSCFSQAEGIEVLGEGALALVPASLEPGSRRAWRWLRAPWESPPCPPPPGLCRFLKKHDLITIAAPERPRLLSWKELFPRIARHKDLLSALLAPPASPDRYYQEIVNEALKAGLEEVEVLQALLWHAPHGEARARPELWRRLLDMPAQLAGTSPARPASPVQGCTRPQRGPASRQPLLQRLKRLTARTLELERQLAALQRTPNLTHNPFGAPAQPGAGEEKRAVPFWEEWLALIQRPGLDGRQIKEFRGAVANFLRENPDLASDEGKLSLVLYCYANYIKINPCYAGLPERERLAGAGKMARTFFNPRNF